MRLIPILLVGRAGATTCDTSWEPLSAEPCSAVGVIPGHGESIPQGGVVRLALTDGCEAPTVMVDGYDESDALPLLRESRPHGPGDNRIWAVYDATALEPGAHDLYFATNGFQTEHIGFDVVASGWSAEPELPKIKRFTHERLDQCETDLCCDPYTEHRYTIRWRIPAAEVNGWMARLVWSDTETWAAELPLLDEQLVAETTLAGLEESGGRCMRAALVDPSDEVVGRGEEVCFREVGDGWCGCGAGGGRASVALVFVSVLGALSRRRQAGQSRPGPVSPGPGPVSG